MKVKSYTNILKADDLNLFWKGNNYYPADVISLTSSDILCDINLTRVVLEGVGSAREKYDALFNDFYAELNRIIGNNEGKAYLFKIEDDPHPKSKLRTAKGILPKKALEANSYMECAITLGENFEIIVAVVLLTNNNFTEVVSHFGNARKCFIFQPNSNALYLDSHKLKDLFISTINEDFTINYPRLLEFVFKELGILYTITGDGGDSALGVDIFYRGIAPPVR
jgi:hypothetical protein